MSETPEDHVKMHGPAIDGSGKSVEADVHKHNVHAFEQAGWTEGPLKAPVVDEAEATAQAKPKTKK